HPETKEKAPGHPGDGHDEGRIDPSAGHGPGRAAGSSGSVPRDGRSGNHHRRALRRSASLSCAPRAPGVGKLTLVTLDGQPKTCTGVPVIPEHEAISTAYGLGDFAAWAPPAKSVRIRANGILEAWALVLDCAKEISQIRFVQGERVRSPHSGKPAKNVWRQRSDSSQPTF